MNFDHQNFNTCQLFKIVFFSYQRNKFEACGSTLNLNITFLSVFVRPELILPHKQRPTSYVPSGCLVHYVDFSLKSQKVVIK
jgi:hypothetical protein